MKGIVAASADATLLIRVASCGEKEVLEQELPPVSSSTSLAQED